MGRGGRGGHRSSGGRHRSHRSSGGRMSSGRSHSRGRSSYGRSSHGGSSYSRGAYGYRAYSRRYYSRGAYDRGYYGSEPEEYSYMKDDIYVSSPVPGIFIICLVSFFIIVGIRILFSFSGNIFEEYTGHTSGFVTRSTIEREALPTGFVHTTDYYTDELRWISKDKILIEGMSNFYEKTGVQPYLYITDTINGTHTPNEEDMDTFAQAKYEELFNDEAHILVIFHEYYEGEYSIWYVVGNQARSVMDEEACNILMDYLDWYYYSDYEDEKYFSKAFNDTGERIMKTERSPWPYVAGYIVILAIIIVLFNWWKKSKQQKNLEYEQNERILNIPLEKFGDKDFDDLTNRYNL